MERPNRMGLRVLHPCEADWEAMEGEGRDRYCHACRKTVHDLSARTCREALTLIRGPDAGDLCIRFRQVGDAVVFRDTPPHLAVAALCSLVISSVLGGCTPHGSGRDLDVGDPAPTVRVPRWVPDVDARDDRADSWDPVRRIRVPLPDANPCLTVGALATTLEPEPMKPRLTSASGTAPPGGWRNL